MVMIMDIHMLFQTFDFLSSAELKSTIKIWQ